MDNYVRKSHQLLYVATWSIDLEQDWPYQDKMGELKAAFRN